MKKLSEMMAPVKQAVNRIQNQNVDNQVIAQRPLFGEYAPKVFATKSSEKKKEKLQGPRNQRDALLDYFFSVLAPKWGGKRPLSKAYLAVKIAHLKLDDLFYLKSVCNDAQRRGTPFAKVFWGSLKPREEGAAYPSNFTPKP